MRFDVLYVSPHPDDVAFSAAAHVAEDVAAGRKVAVLTLFEMPDSGGAAYVFGDKSTRRAEDEAFATIAGVVRIDAGYKDAVARNARYQSPRLLQAPLRDDERPLVASVRERIESFVRDGCTRVVAPLGVGEHVDHQIAHEAARTVSCADLSFYEDTPHVLTTYQLARRFSRLGLRPAGNGDASKPTAADRSMVRGSVCGELRAVVRTWRSMPLLDMALGVRPGAPRPWWLGIARFFALAYVVTPYLFTWPGRARTARPVVASVLRGPGVAPAKLAAIGAYASQWPGFRPTLEAWRAALEDYARELGEEGVIERSWRLPPE